MASGVARALVGPAAFGGAALLGGYVERDYRGRDEPISALAARGSRAAGIMVPGFLGLATGSILLARDLRGSAAAPRPVPVMLTLAGVTVAGAGLARCSDKTCPTRFLGDANVTPSDDLHAVFSMATFALWIAIPLVAARRAVDAGSTYRRRSKRLGLATLFAALLMGLSARPQSSRWSGALQRVMIASALAWYPVAASAASNSTQ